MPDPADATAEPGEPGAQRPDRSDGGIMRIGWREWVALPQFNIRAIKAKVDTGARTSALHAYSVERFLHHGAPRVRFMLHPRRLRTDIAVVCECDIVDERAVTDSGGHQERRIVIVTDIVLGCLRYPIELTITDRDTMRYRMLLGRSAMRDRLTVDPALSYRAGRPQLPRKKMQ